MDTEKRIAKKNFVYSLDEYEETHPIGEIASIQLSIEYPERMLSISRVENCVLFDENDTELLDDQSIVDNTEYTSDDELIEDIAKHYNISKDFITIL